MKSTILSLSAALLLGASSLSAQNVNLWLTTEGSGVQVTTGHSYLTPPPPPARYIYTPAPKHYNGKKWKKQMKKYRKAQKKYEKARRDLYRATPPPHRHR